MASHFEKRKKATKVSITFVCIYNHSHTHFIAMLLSHNWIEIDLHRVNLISKWFPLFDVANDGFQRDRLLNRQKKNKIYIHAVDVFYFQLNKLKYANEPIKFLRTCWETGPESIYVWNKDEYLELVTIHTKVAYKTNSRIKCSAVRYQSSEILENGEIFFWPFCSL